MMSPDRRASAGGFTLVEVLVALAIIALGLIAVFGQFNQSAIAASRLRDKTFAHWIAMNLLTERRLATQPPGGSSESDEIEMANSRWHYEITYSDTDVEGMRRAEVAVSFADDPDRPLTTAVGFLMQRAGGAIADQSGTGWPIVGEQVPSPDGPVRTDDAAQTPPVNENK
jgi:general secretion pathway protein I